MNEKFHNFCSELPSRSMLPDKRMKDLKAERRWWQRKGQGRLSPFCP
jgi:hypothetical protein